MKAAILREIGAPLTTEEVTLGELRPTEVRIRVASSGLCHTDYHFMSGHLPHTLPVVLGHEASGIVEAVGVDVRGLNVGDALVSCLSSYCGCCAECHSGHSHRCDDRPKRSVSVGEARIMADGEPIHQYGQIGGFAEEMLVDVRSVVRLPEGMPLDLSALLGCAVLTGVGAALNSAAVRPGQSVAVIGCGGIGLNVIQGARIAGAERIVAIDSNPRKKGVASALGATDFFPPGDRLAEEVIELTRGGVDAAFEAAGLAAAARQAFSVLRKGGTLVLIGAGKSSAEVSFPAIPFLQKELRVVGSLMGSAPFKLEIPRYAKLYLDGHLQLEPLVSDRIALADINEGYARLLAGDAARSIITFP